MRRKATLVGATLTAILFLAGFSISVTPSAVADECIQKTRTMLYSQPTNSRYTCEFDGKKLMIDDLGRRSPAPEGVYKKISDGKECFIGKGGFVLYCKL